MTFMKKILLIIAIAISTNIYAQKGSSQFSLFGGFEHFPELKCRNGYNVGVEFKHYLNNRVYALANFHAGVNDGTKNVSYTRDEIDYNFDLSNSVRDYMLGFGIGGDLLHINRHKIYMQGTVGIGSSEQYEDGITLSPGGAYDIVKTYEEKSTRFAISASAGYDYQLTDWLSIGVNYTGWQIGYEYKNSANVKLGIIF
jgi:opacity protein-like surface antigen